MAEQKAKRVFPPGELRWPIRAGTRHRSSRIGEFSSYLCSTGCVLVVPTVSAQGRKSGHHRWVQYTFPLPDTCPRSNFSSGQDPYHVSTHLHGILRLLTTLTG